MEGERREGREQNRERMGGKSMRGKGMEGVRPLPWKENKTVAAYVNY